MGTGTGTRQKSETELDDETILIWHEPLRCLQKVKEKMDASPDLGLYKMWVVVRCEGSVMAYDVNRSDPNTPTRPQGQHLAREEEQKRNIRGRKKCKWKL